VKEFKLNRLIFLSLCLIIASCGVKGDPLPPMTPAELSRGKPTYKGATEGIDLKDISDEDELEKKSKKKKNQ